MQKIQAAVHLLTGRILERIGLEYSLQERRRIAIRLSKDVRQSLDQRRVRIIGNEVAGQLGADELCGHRMMRQHIQHLGGIVFAAACRDGQA